MGIYDLWWTAVRVYTPLTVSIELVNDDVNLCYRVIIMHVAGMVDLSLLSQQLKRLLEIVIIVNAIIELYSMA